MAQFFNEILHPLGCQFIFGHLAQFADADPFISRGFAVLQNDAVFIYVGIAQILDVDRFVLIVVAGLSCREIDGLR